jgi:hypothetical protein
MVVWYFRSRSIDHALDFHHYYVGTADEGMSAMSSCAAGPVSVITGDKQPVS